MFRRATSVRTWPKGEFDWSGTTETYHWLEVQEDRWVGTSRLCENEEEAVQMQKETGHAKPQEYKTDKDGRKYRTMQITMDLGYIRQTSDPDTVEVFDPA